MDDQPIATPTKAHYQRTFEEMLAGVPAREYFVTRSKKPLVRNGRRYAQGQKYAQKKKKGRRKPVFGRENWLNIVKVGPSHPKWTEELAKKAWDMHSRAGKNGAKTRRSLPKGYRAAEWKPIWIKRIEEATKMVDDMISNDLVALPDEDLERQAAKEALVFNVALVRSQEHTIENRMKASRTVLDFCKSKPQAKTEVTLKTAEDWLKQIAGEK